MRSQKLIPQETFANVILSTAHEKDKIALITGLLAKGVNINATIRAGQETALFVAAQKKEMLLVNFLLRQGAEADEVTCRLICALEDQKIVSQFIKLLEKKLKDITRAAYRLHDLIESPGKQEQEIARSLLRLMNQNTANPMQNEIEKNKLAAQVELLKAGRLKSIYNNIHGFYSLPSLLALEKDKQIFAQYEEKKQDIEMNLFKI